MKLSLLSAALAAIIICTACGDATPTSLPTQAATATATANGPVSTAADTSAPASTAAPANTSAPAATPTVFETPSGTALSPATPLNFSGNTFTTTDPFSVSAAAKYVVDWQYSGKGQFSLWVENNSEYSTDPKYDRILIKNIDNPATSGEMTIDLIPGNYVVDVEIADGPWTVTLKQNP